MSDQYMQAMKAQQFVGADLSGAISGGASPKQSDMVNIAFQIEEETKQFMDLAAQLESLADRLFGSIAEKNPGPGPRPVPNGALMEIADRIDGLRSAKVRFINAMSRLGSLA